MGVQIREARPEEYGEVGELTVAAYRALPVWVGDEYGAHLADVAGRVGDGAVALVAEDDDGSLVGSVALVLERGPLFEWGAAATDADCGFRMLGVVPAARGRGVGPALVEECLRRSRAAGKRRMLIASAEFMTTAHRMYEQRFGFRRVPALDRQWGDICGYAFALDLVDGTGTTGKSARPGRL